MVYGMGSSLESDVLSLTDSGLIIAMDDLTQSATALDPAIAAPPTENATATHATEPTPVLPTSSSNSARMTSYHT